MKRSENGLVPSTSPRHVLIAYLERFIIWKWFWTINKSCFCRGLVRLFIIRLAPRVRERARWTESRAVIGYPSRQDGAILPARETGCVPQGTFTILWCFIPYNKSFIDQACSVKMAGYWPRSFFACLWTSTSSRSINTQKKNLANIQPSWPHAWSITHTSFAFKKC